MRRTKHGVITSARLITEQLGETEYRMAFVTLTYAKKDDWSPLDITEYLLALRQWCKGRSYSMAYVWVAELQPRRAAVRVEHVVHYHLLVWWWGKAPDHVLVNLPMPDGGRYGGQVMWRHGMSRIEAPRNAVGYIAKYASKGSVLDAWPTGMRIWGCGGLGLAQRLELRWWRSPIWLRKFVPLEEGVRRLKHGWWANLSTRWCYRSPWEFDLATLTCRWRGWTWDDVCMDPDSPGSAWAELCGSG